MKWKNSLLCMAAMVVLAGVTCYILLKDHSMGTLWAVLKNADLRFVLLGLFLMVLFYGSALSSTLLHRLATCLFFYSLAWASSAMMPK
ncbi:hypothetical protein [Hungatella sp.]|uniref:hypothetical protein n=1 Tax=Hungatella sp. TaxID=2613924 RepID=UPI002A832D53|nr:hypothetical protein [Hungatella sp.]